jgi:lipopolysaccharide transport system ATP-binding protein
MAKAITVEGLSKAYQLGDFGTGTISRDVERFIARVRGKEDPYLRIGETNNRTVKGESDIVWCLKDLNFDIEEGDAVGIIGRNGAGKSTLLKILSRITSPTTGSIKIKGRIASLLEVGTGFHPELSGRENIYLNGAILGMRKSEIKRKFDEIVDFAGVERYIDTPVKRYSSGMYVRLAFAVAAHLESEILIVDEVLAVGDADFQKKCLGKMGDISKGEGRTVLFVSHNMAAIEKICEKAILLKNGELTDYRDSSSIINSYIQNSLASNSVINVPIPKDTSTIQGYVYKVHIEDLYSNIMNEIRVGNPWQIRVFFKIEKKVNNFIIALGITSMMEVNIRTSWSSKSDIEKGYYEAVFREKDLLLSAGSYNITIGLSSNEQTFQYNENVAVLAISPVADLSLNKSIIRISDTGFILNPMDIEILASTY